jgi:hypothetical protein
MLKPSKKLRGGDNALNLIIIDGKFYQITPDLASFVFKNTQDKCLNIQYLGYSDHHQMLYLHMRDGNRYIYNDVTTEEWSVIANSENIPSAYRDKTKGKSYYQTEQNIKPISNEEVLKAYEELEYWKCIHEGMWMTDRPDLVIDPQNVLFQPTT